MRIRILPVWCTPSRSRLSRPCCNRRAASAPAAERVGKKIKIDPGLTSSESRAYSEIRPLVPTPPRSLGNLARASAHAAWKSESVRRTRQTRYANTPGWCATVYSNRKHRARGNEWVDGWMVTRVLTVRLNLHVQKEVQGMSFVRPALVYTQTPF